MRRASTPRYSPLRLSFSSSLQLPQADLAELDEHANHVAAEGLACLADVDERKLINLIQLVYPPLRQTQAGCNRYLYAKSAKLYVQACIRLSTCTHSVMFCPCIHLMLAVPCCMPASSIFAFSVPLQEPQH